MAMLDVSVALTNPYTQDSFDVYRKQQVVNSYGEMEVSVTQISGIRGVIYPEGANDLARRPEAELNAKTIVVITRFALRGESDDSNDGKDYQPDTIGWNGSFFLVTRVEDYSKFAAGFVKCSCTATNMVDQAPVTR